jgi:hypothetical protein
MYIDDLLIAGPMDDDINRFKTEAQERFRMSNLGLLTYYLGIEVCQDDSVISLCQKAYARRLLEKSGMADCNPSLTLMENRLQLNKSSPEALVDATE